MKIVLLVVGVLVVVVGWGVGGGGQVNSIGVVDGKLQRCSDKPNCVCSCYSDRDNVHQIEPLDATGVTDPMGRLVDIVTAMSNTTIVTASDGYLHAEYRSTFFRFVDDVEFLYDADRNIVHLRSASRVGYSDLGVNRKRMEQVRTLFEKTRPSE